MASPKSRSKKKPAKRGGGGLFTFLLLAGPAGIFAMPTATLFAVGMIPSFVAYIIDRDPDKTAPMTVAPLNICGVLPFTMEMWKHDHTMQAATHFLGDPLTWLVMYGASAIGWALYFLVPPIVTNFEVMRAEARIDSLNGKKKDLVEEWGGDVALTDEALVEKHKATTQAAAQSAAPAGASGAAQARS
ncbi:MAG: hypothetical protein WCJ64_06850 [Rhodospirillaceae bacterium]